MGTALAAASISHASESGEPTSVSHALPELLRPFVPEPFDISKLGLCFFVGLGDHNTAPARFVTGGDVVAVFGGFVAIDRPDGFAEIKVFGEDDRPPGILAPKISPSSSTRVNPP